jgi:hypothetical protein
MHTLIRILILTTLVLGAGGVATAQTPAASPPYVPPAAPAAAASPADKLKQAKKLDGAGSYDEALVAIDEGLAADARHVLLLDLKGDVLFKLREYAAARAAYQAVIDAGAKGRVLAKSRDMVKRLAILEATKLEVAVEKGTVSIYLKTKTDGLFCTAAPVCTKALLPGGYNVIAEAPGFEPWTGRVTVTQGTTAKLAIALVEKPSLVTVQATPADARITIGGAPYTAAVELPAGKHEVVVEKPGYVPAKGEVVAREGLPVVFKVGLVAEAPKVAVAPPTVTVAPSNRIFSGRRVAAAMIGGIGLVSLGAGVGLGLSSNTLEDSSYEVCPIPDRCADVQRAEDYQDRAETRALQANIAFGVAGAAAVTAVVLWFTGKPEAETRRLSITPRFGGGQGADASTGLDLSLRF